MQLNWQISVETMEGFCDWQVPAFFTCATGLVYAEREQETARVCRATGQESQDKAKETQMEVLD